jgi:hypothetical protein
MYIKILSEDLKHNGFQYKEGLNVDTIPFNPTGSCLPGGLYFTDEKYLLDFLGYGTKIADVEIPSNAKVYRDGNKWKADKIILKNIRDIKDLPQWQDKKFCLSLLNHRFARFHMSYVQSNDKEVQKQWIKNYINTFADDKDILVYSMKYLELCKS